MTEIINGVAWERTDSSEHSHLHVAIGGLPSNVANMTDRWPHVNGHPLSFFGTVNSRYTTGDVLLFLGVTEDESWKPEGGSNCAYVEGENWPEWVEFQSVDEPVSFCESTYASDTVVDEPNWLQGEETPSGYSFIAEIPSQIDGGEEVNIGEGYGTAYVFASEDGKAARMLWQS